MCSMENTPVNQTPVADFTKVGFQKQSTQLSAETQKQLENVSALKIQACVGASYNSTTNKICFKIPIYGDVCIESPVHIPVSAELKACVETCGGSLLPKGVKGSVYMDNQVIWTGIIVGSC